MKFMLQWHTRSNAEPDDFVEAGESLLKAFSGWSPPEGVEIGEFVSRVDGQGGLMIVETDDLRAVNAMTSQYSAWFDWEVAPVLDVAESAAGFGEGLAWAKQSID